jgi:hypothetical protein
MAKLMNSIFTVLVFLTLIFPLILDTERSYSQPQDVNVVNPETDPVPTYNVDNAALHPVQIHCEIIMPSGTALIQQSCTDQNVPLGKRLVIEQVTAQARFNNTNNYPRVSIGLISFDMNGDLKMVFHNIAFEQQVLTKYSNIFYTTQNVRLYNVQQGINISFGRDTTDGSYSGKGVLRISITGHFVDINS